MTLQGQVAIVTGANGQIGQAVVLALAQQGATLVLADLAETAVTSFDNAIYVQTDVTSLASVTRLVEAAERIDYNLKTGTGVVHIGPPRAHRPRQTGGRFSANARAPSWASSDENT